MTDQFLSASEFCFLLGAGASKPARVPTMPEMGEEFVAKFSLPTLRDFLERIDSEMAQRDAHWAAGDRNIEDLLKVLQDKSDSLRKQKLIPFPAGATDPSLTKQQVDARSSVIVAFELKKFILNKVTRHADTNYLAPLRQFLPQEGSLDIFSLNYDTVIEDFCSSAGVPLTDGFDSRGQWHPELFLATRTGIRLWKLHGSATWTPSVSGWPRKTFVPGSWRRHLLSGHTASVTMETALVWPAAKEKMERPLLLLHSSFQRRLLDCRVLIVAGYRFADRRIREMVIQALKVNNALRLILLCGDPGSQEAKTSLLQDDNQIEDRIEIFDPSLFDEGIKDGRLRAAVQRAGSGIAINRTGNQKRNGGHGKTETLCLGQFNAVAKVSDDLLLARGNRRTALLRYSVARDELIEICSWRGWARGLAVINDRTAIVADCSRAGFKAGWGIVWKIDLTTGKRESLLPSTPVDFARVMIMTAKYRFQSGMRGAFIDRGMLSWPTSVDVVPGRNAVIVTEARRPVLIDSDQRCAVPLKGSEFFNLASVQLFGPMRCLLLEHVLRYEGVLWNLNYETGETNPILAGIQNGTSLLVSPNMKYVFIAQGDEHPDGKIWRLDLTTNAVDLVADRLDEPRAMAALGDGSLAVATAGAIVKIKM